MGIVVAESVAGDVGADFADAGATGLAVTIGLAGAAGFLAGAIGFNAAPGLVGATGLVGAAGLEGGGMRNLLELVLDECDAEGRKGLAWVGEASPRQVLAEGEGNWLCPPPAPPRTLTVMDVPLARTTSSSPHPHSPWATR